MNRLYTLTAYESVPKSIECSATARDPRGLSATATGSRRPSSSVRAWWSSRGPHPVADPEVPVPPGTEYTDTVWDPLSAMYNSPESVRCIPRGQIKPPLSTPALPGVEAPKVPTCLPFLSKLCTHPLILSATYVSPYRWSHAMYEGSPRVCPDPPRSLHRRTGCPVSWLKIPTVDSVLCSAITSRSAQSTPRAVMLKNSPSPRRPRSGGHVSSCSPARLK